MADPTSPDPARRVEELSDTMLERGLTDTEHAELMQLLSKDSSARDRFFDAVHLHALLREEVGKNGCNPLSSKLFGVRAEELAEITERLKNVGWDDRAKAVSSPAKPIEIRGSAGRRWAGWPALAVAVSVLAVAVCYEAWLRPLGVKVWGGEPPVVNTAPVRPNNLATVPVAKLTYTSGCTWGGLGGPVPALNSQVGLGNEVVLHEGIAEFRLSSGVSINVEGPSALVITSPTSLILQHGTATVFVPAGVPDFRLAAASCRITTRAAEFGVQVAGGKVDVHTFTGTIIAAPAIQDDSLGEVDYMWPGSEGVEGGTESLSDSEFTTLQIAAGRALTMDCEADAVTVSESHPADESRFATRLSMAGPLAISKEYIDAVLKSKPLGYWRFENSAGNVVANEIGELAGLAISGKIYLTKDGRNHAVELGRPGFDGAMYCKNELNLPPQSDYSVEAWIKPSHFHNGAILSMTVVKEDGKASANLYLQTVAASTRYAEIQRRVRFLHRDPPGGDPKTGTNCVSKAPYRLRRWQHVVAVKQGPQMKLYLDGNVVDTQLDPSSLTQHLRIIVGQLGETAGVHRFIGQMDELAIFGRALTDEEIKHRFALVDSQPVVTRPETDGI